MGDEAFVPDAIADRSLTPLLREGVKVLLALDADRVAHTEFARLLGDAYTAGLVDGARHAVGEIAVEAERRGLLLRLAPELQAACDGADPG